jgi:hypothetical protein
MPIIDAHIHAYPPAQRHEQEERHALADDIDPAP